MVVAAVEGDGEVQQTIMIIIREFVAERDAESVAAVERMCEVGPSGSISLFTDLFGDPVARVRHSPAYLMLVAESCSDSGREIVGVIRGCIKIVSSGAKKPTSTSPIYTKTAYLLGLRVSPSHRRRGVGLKLVQRMEQWFREKGAEYSYMATEKDNKASIQLFTRRCGYSKFRTPAVLVQPVFAHGLALPRRTEIQRISNADADALYRRRFSTVEFFPRDIDAVLNNTLNLGTFIATKSGRNSFQWTNVDDFLASPPESWAVLSVWNSKGVFNLEVRGAGRWRRAAAAASRAADRLLPWLRIPSVPNIFRPFGFYFLYGVGGEGPAASELVAALCRMAHNMARSGGAAVVASEVASCEPLRRGIPHWRRLSCEEDVWCMKRLGDEYSDGELGDWTKAPPQPSIFVDPREL